MSEWKAAAEWADQNLKGLPASKRRVNALINRESWKGLGPEKARRRHGRGGGWEYHVTCLPEEAQSDFRARRAALEAETQVAKRAAEETAVTVKTEASLGARQRRVMEARATVLREIDRRVIADSQSQRGALLSLISDFESDRVFANEGRHDFRSLPASLFDACLTANDRGRGISRSQVYGWIKAHKDGGVLALAPEVTRTKQDVPDWMSAYLRHYCVPSKPSIAHALERYAERVEDPSALPNYDQVRRALKALKGTSRFLDAHKGREGQLALKARMGFVTRTLEGLDPTVVYTADGKTFDAMVAHPRHGRPFRPEITTVMDIVTRKIVGWSVDLAENTVTVADALRRACETHGIPAIFYTDRGAGYRNDYLDHDTLGLCSRLGITPSHSLPYNSQARGLIERLNGTVWNKLAKEFSTYMGADMDRQARQKSHKEIAKDIKEFGTSHQLPSFEMFMEAAAAAVDAYNSAIHSALRVINPQTKRPRKASPNEVWADFEARGFEIVPLEAHEADDLFRPFEKRKVLRGQVTLNTNQYFDAAMEPYHGMDVLVGYDLHDASKVWIRKLEQANGQPVAGALICVASFWNNKERYMPKTMTEAAIERRAKGKLKRIDAHREEALAEARPPLQINVLKEVPISIPANAQPEPIAQPVAEIVEMPAAKPRKPQFEDDTELALHIIAHPDDLTTNRRRVLVSLFQSPSARALFEMRGGSVDDLKNLLTETAHLQPNKQSSI